MTGWILYGVVCVLWGIFAARMHKKIGYSTDGIRSLLVVGIVNAIGCPIALMIAIVRAPIKYV